MPDRPRRPRSSNWLAVLYVVLPEEYIAHQTKIRGFRDHDECDTYRLDHHRRVAERANARGLVLKQAPRDACAHLRPAEAGR